MFKSAEERAEERALKEAERAREEAARAEQARVEDERRRREAFLASPVGQATAAKEAGEPFFEIQLEVGSHRRTASFGMVEHADSSTVSSGRILGEIERAGWRLEHAGYIYVITEQTSSERMFLSGQATAVTGMTVGIYLFRNTDEPSPLTPAGDDAGGPAS